MTYREQLELLHVGVPAAPPPERRVLLPDAVQLARGVPEDKLRVSAAAAAARLHGALRA